MVPPLFAQCPMAVVRRAAAAVTLMLALQGMLIAPAQGAPAEPTDQPPSETRTDLQDHFTPFRRLLDRLSLLGTNLKLEFNVAPAIPAGAGKNWRGPLEPTEIRVDLKAGIRFDLRENAAFVARLRYKYYTDKESTLRFDRLFLDWKEPLRMVLPAQAAERQRLPGGLALRLGVDAITLGPIGLLLDGRFYDDTTLGGDGGLGIQVWLPEYKSIRPYLFGQYVTNAQSSNQYFEGIRVDVLLSPGWTLGLNVRFDNSPIADACPGLACSSGAGYQADLTGVLGRDTRLVAAFASYTQSGDVASDFLQVNLVFDGRALSRAGVRDTTLTLSYKDFGPYTIPGGASGKAPRGGFWTRDAFNLFNINDNLSSLGVRLDTRAAGYNFSAYGEWGAYKGGGPGYQIYSVEVKTRVSQPLDLVASFSSYSVTGGSVLTSPRSGLILGDATVWQLMLVATF